MKNEISIAVIGLGYVGLPLALEFGKKLNVIGFDINKKRVNELREFKDITGEFKKNDFYKSKNLKFSCISEDLKNINYYIITVPTPIFKNKKPNLTPLKNACKLVGKFINKNDTVIFESTVYPGCTEEVCIPILETSSKLKINIDFHCGYSPERINPGDKNHTLTKIKKITSGSNQLASKRIDSLYKQIIKAGTYNVKSIKIAEAAKIIENTQRDINIALINEFTMIFKKLNINSKEVFDAAETKWNFIPFRPGLVGGHCIGVDPYYLTHKAINSGYNPKLIISGRKINDDMGYYVKKDFCKALNRKGISIEKSRILVIGITFKENCKDIRNSLVPKVIIGLQQLVSKVDVFDPLASYQEVKDTYNIKLLKKIKKRNYDGILVAVPHKNFEKFFDNNLKLYCRDKFKFVIYNIKSSFNLKSATDTL